jgi:hypothetical protein
MSKVALEKHIGFQMVQLTLRKGSSFEPCIFQPVLGPIMWVNPLCILDLCCILCLAAEV